MRTADATWPGAIALELRDVHKSFGGAAIVKGVSAAIHAGEFVSLLGPSGCGKSTTLRMIAGFELPDRGQILIGGKDVTDTPAHKRNLGMMFQSYGLFPHMTVADNVAYGLKRRGVPKAERLERTIAALNLVRLGSMGDRYPRQMSGGQQQRVALARALVIEPSLLLLDEPLSNLDAKLRVEMRQEIRELQRKTNVTAVFVTHDQEEALSVSDRIIVMSAGNVEQIDRPEAVYASPATRFVADFMGETNFVEGVVSREGDVSHLVHESGVKFPVQSSKAANGARLLVSLRPEAIAISGAGSTGGIDAVVEDMVYRGAFSVVRCRINPKFALHAVQQNIGGLGTSVASGDRVSIAWSPEAARVL